MVNVITIKSIYRHTTWHGTDEDTARTIAEASPVGFGGDTFAAATGGSTKLWLQVTPSNIKSK